MNNRIQYTSLTLAIGAALCSALPAQAQSQGQWLFRGGFTSVKPQVKSGELSAPTVPDTRIDVTPDTVIGGGVSYMLTDNFSVDLPLAMPVHSRIMGDGAIKSSGEIGHTKALPATAFAQYRFGSPSSSIRPYLGAGPTFAYFFGTTGNGALTGLTNTGSASTTLKIKNKLGLTAQVGATAALSDRWFVDAVAYKTWLKTTSTLSTGQTIDVKLDPVTVGLYVGYRY